MVNSAVIAIAIAIVLVGMFLVVGGVFLDHKEKKMECELLRVLILYALQNHNENKLMMMIDDARLNEQPHYDRRLGIIEALALNALSRDKYHDFLDDVKQAYHAIPNGIKNWETVVGHLHYLVDRDSVTVSLNEIGGI